MSQSAENDATATTTSGQPVDLLAALQRSLTAAKSARATTPVAPDAPTWPRCDTCSDAGRIPWMSEGDPNFYQEPDDEGMLPCPDCRRVIPPVVGGSQ